MDKARLRENARIVRSLQAELRAVSADGREHYNRERYEKMMALQREGKPVPEEGYDVKFRVAQSRMLARLTEAFIALTEELAGDLDQDIRPT
jgi:hypothetical protein